MKTKKPFPTVIAASEISGLSTVATSGAYSDLSGKPTLASLGGANSAIEFVIDGAGSAITTGFKGYLEIPFNCTVTGWTLLADVSGSVTIDITSDSYANYGTNTSMVGAGAKPNTSSATKGQAAPASWTATTIASGNVLGFNVTAAATSTRVILSLKVTKT